MLTEHHSLILAAARYKDLVYLCVRNKELDSDDVAHSLYDAYDQGKILYVGKTEWDTVGIAIARKPDEIMLAASPDGQVYSYVGGNEGSETIPNKRGNIRNLNSINGLVYACGVKRQVFRRDSALHWTDISAPEPEKDEKRMIGFEGIDGFSNSEIYAAGWSGEIFKFDGQKWVNAESPTNNILTAVACGGDGTAYIVGKNGTLIQGSNDIWEPVDTMGIVDDFWDVHWFNDRVYISSMARLYEYNGKTFQIVDVGADKPTTCHKLTSADGIMWSIGTNDLFMFDGSTWHRIV